MNTSESNPSENPQQNNSDPLLPGFDEIPQSEINEDNDSTQQPPVHLPPSQTSADQAINLRKTVVTLLVAIIAGCAIVAAHKLIHPRIVIQTVEKNTQLDSDGIPLSFLPDTADPALWPVLSQMSGEINGQTLQFKRGCATANGKTFMILLDFCRQGADIYAKVVADKTYVVRCNSQGQIIQSFPAPKNNRPLKSIIGK